MSALNRIIDNELNTVNENLGKKLNTFNTPDENANNDIKDVCPTSLNIKHIHCEGSDYEIGVGYVKCLKNNIVIQQEPPQKSLSYYVVHNDIDILKDKLASGEHNPNSRDDFGITCSWTPLYWSVKIGNVEAARILLEFGADINLVIHDFHECCGTVLDLATLREDLEMEEILRHAADSTGVNLGQSFKALRTKLRGKAPAFNFRHYGKNSQ